MKWQKKKAVPLAPKLVQKYQLRPLQAKLLALRGINSDQKLNFWLHADLADLADPTLMHDLPKAVNRIEQAIDRGEKITVYGDYDADGITATTIMVATLLIMGANVHYFIPDRFQDGYGPNLKRYQEIIANGTKLIITVDNGITGVKEVAYAQTHHVDVIVTDHHTLQKQLPPAYAIVHSDYPNQKYPFNDYCGAGVAYTLCRGLMKDPLPDLLDLAVIGTIGDLVKVTGEGHILVKEGLKVLNRTERPGLRVLIKNAGLRLGQIDETDIGFQIAPRLNAVGRLANAKLAVALLLSDDEVQAKQLADQVETLNKRRQSLTAQVFARCQAQIKANSWERRKTLVLYDPHFHEGVLGLVANKLVQLTNKPTLVLTQNKKGEVKGSGRSPAGFNLFNALDKLKDDLFTQFGGHDFACGFAVKAGKIEALRKAFEASYQGPVPRSSQSYDLELPLTKLSKTTWKEIKQVVPFGTGNPQPIFSLSQPQIHYFRKMGKDKQHISFSVQASNGHRLRVVGFNKGFLDRQLLPFIKQIFITLSLNRYRQRTTLQGIIIGFAFASPVVGDKEEKVIDLRHESLIMGFADRYLLFDARNLPFARSSLGLPDSKIELIKNYQAQGEKIVLLDMPHNQRQLNAGLRKNYRQLYLRFLLDQLPVQSIPSSSAFSRVLKYIYLHPRLQPKDYRVVAPYLNLDYAHILFILRVLFELKFINLKNGSLVGIPHPTPHPLTSSRYFQATTSQIKFTTQLRQMPSLELLQYVNNLRN